MGLGMALMEEYLPDRPNLHDYLIPTIGDVPEIEPILIEKPDPEGPSGARGLGEHTLIPTAPAILNAIRHATGAEITRLPALPHRVLAAIRAPSPGDDLDRSPAAGRTHPRLSYWLANLESSRFPPTGGKQTKKPCAHLRAHSGRNGGRAAQAALPGQALLARAPAERGLQPPEAGAAPSPRR